VGAPYRLRPPSHLRPPHPREPYDRGQDPDPGSSKRRGRPCGERYTPSDGSAKDSDDSGTDSRQVTANEFFTIGNSRKSPIGVWGKSHTVVLQSSVGRESSRRGARYRRMGFARTLRGWLLTRRIAVDAYLACDASPFLSKAAAGDGRNRGWTQPAMDAAGDGRSRRCPRVASSRYGTAAPVPTRRLHRSLRPVPRPPLVIPLSL